MRHEAFAPVVAPDVRLLVLGSLPGAASLAAGRYYAHPQNRFWHLIGAAMGREDLPALPYEERLDTLLARGVGLWDTIASAERKGSLDAAIRAAQAAPLRALVNGLPGLRAVAFNGATSARIGRRALAGTTLALVDLPSSSPANASISLARKHEAWGALQQFLA